MSIDRSRYLALAIPDPDTTFAVFDRQVADVQTAQLRSPQAGIDQQLYDQFVNKVY